MTIVKLAFDRGTARTVDKDGRLHISSSHISKATINPYMGKEIPGGVELGLDPDKIYKLFRDPAELELAADTFARLPILWLEHKYLNVDNVADLKDCIVGTIGSDVKFNAPYLDADLCFWDAEAIAGIESEAVRELSCSYHYVPVMEPGEFEGAPYDGRMTEIKGNHLALVEVGRAGPDVVAADRNPFTIKETATMKMTKLGKAIFVALCALSPTLAADSAFPGLIGTATRKTVDKKKVTKAILASDVQLDPTQLDNILDALIGVEDEPMAQEPIPAAAGDEGGAPDEEIRKLLAGKVDDETIAKICAMMKAPATAGDGDLPTGIKKAVDGGMNEEDVKAAMDASNKALRKQLLEAEQARRDVAPVVGDMVVAEDSAANIYKFALKHMKVDHEGVEGDASLRALFRVASANVGKGPVVVAQDSDGLVTMFPAVGRFRNA